MRRAVVLIGIAALAAACAAPAPSPTVEPRTSPSPSATATVAPTPSPTPFITPAVVIPEESFGPALPPLEVDWTTAPKFPLPVLAAGATAVPAIGASGCASLMYEPASDEMGRSAESDGGCLVNPVLSFATAVRVGASSGLLVKAPKGWALGAQVVSNAAPYGPFWIINSSRLPSPPSGATPLFEVHGAGWIELARGEGFRLDVLDALAPDAAGDYLVSVQAQVGKVPSEWRILGRTYYFWVQVR